MNYCGWNVLHIAAMFGQTQTSLFLLRIGADKRAHDSEERTPGMLAAERGYQVTAQTIFSYKPPPPTSKELLDYLIEQDEKKKNAGANQSLIAQVASGFASIAKGFNALAGAVSGFFNYKPAVKNIDINE